MSMSGNNSGDDLRSDGGGGNPDWHPPPPPYGYAAPYGYEGQVRSYAYYAARPPLPPAPPPQYHPPTDAYGGYGGYYDRPHLQNHHVHAPPSHAHYAPLPRQQPRVPGPMMQGQMSPSRNFQQHHHHVPPHAHYPPLPRQQPPEPTMQTQMSPSRSPSRSNTMGTLATPVRPTGGRPVSTPGTSGRSSRRRTDNNTDSNNEFVFTRMRASAIHLTRQQPPSQPHGCQNHIRLDTTAKPAQPTASTTKLTADQVKEELDKDAYTQLKRYGTNNEFILHNVAVIETSPEVGYKLSLNPEEIEEAYGPDGLITNHIVKSQILRDRSENKLIKVKRPMKVSHICYEIVRSVYCNVAHGTDAACQVQGLLVRFQHEPSDTRDF